MRRIGAGGMGEVWLAEQQHPIRRRVAIKIIKAGLDTADVLARFEAERQALALMDHPAIAKVLDAGSTPTGRPYFVMEHVDGIPITQHCDLNRLGIAERLALFLEVCAGVQHAHEKAVLHRDLKPSNVLVSVHDGHAAPKIIDFGLAKAIGGSLTDHSLHTLVGVPVGTPGYMSPEQALLTAEGVDTRTDVYSLGVILYELLTGSLPFDIEEIRRRIHDALPRMLPEVDAPRPSARLASMPAGTSGEVAGRRRADAPSLRRRLSGDLDWITMKCLERDRARRYGSPALLAEDVRRHLGNEPVQAGPPDALYRLGKFARRHRLAVAAALILALGLATGIVGATIGLVRARRAESAALAEAATADRVSGLLADLLGTVDAARMGDNLVGDLRHRAGAAAAARGASAPEIAATEHSVDTALSGVNRTDAALGILDHEILSRAAKSIESEMARDPLIAARLQITIAQTYRRLGLYPNEEPLARQAYETRRRILGADDRLTLEAAGNLAIALTDLHRLDDAETLLREILASRRRTLGPEDPATLEAMHNLAWVCQESGRLKDAIPLYEETLAARRRVLGPDNTMTLRTMNNLANAYNALGRVEDGLRLNEETYTIRRRVLGAENSDTLASMNNLSLSLLDVGRLDEAEKLQRESLDLRRRLQGQTHPDTIGAMYTLSSTLYAAGQYDESARLCEQIIESVRASHGEDDPETLDAMEALGRTRRAQGRLPEAIALLRQTVAKRSAAGAADDPDRLAALESLAETLAEAGHTDDARAATRSFLSERRKAAEAADADAEAKNTYAFALLTCVPEDMRDPAAAVRFAEDAAEKTHREDADVLDTLALAYERVGEPSRATETERRAIALLPAGRSPSRTRYERRLAELEGGPATPSAGQPRP